MNTLVYYLHILSIVIFSIYIITDRVYIRIFLDKKSRENFYKTSRIPLLTNSVIIVTSGTYLLFFIYFTPIIYIKIVAALLLLYGFFNCPFYMKQQECEIRRFMYRFGVVGLLIITIILGMCIQQ